MNFRLSEGYLKLHSPSLSLNTNQPQLVVAAFDLRYVDDASPKFNCAPNEVFMLTNYSSSFKVPSEYVSGFYIGYLLKIWTE